MTHEEIQQEFKKRKAAVESERMSVATKYLESVAWTANKTATQMAGEDKVLQVAAAASGAHFLLSDVKQYKREMEVANLEVGALDRAANLCLILDIVADIDVTAEMLDEIVRSAHNVAEDGWRLGTHAGYWDGIQN